MPGSFLQLLYRLYASTIVPVVVFVLFCPLIIVAPTLTLRREIGRLCVRVALAAAFIPLRIRGQHLLPPTPCVAVANHASYLDGLVLTAALPRRFTFLVQHGAASWPYIGLVIKRMGVRFIDRGSVRASARQARELIRALQAGQSLAIFPEGTFAADPGLLPFRRGAFSIAAMSGVPVLPAVIRGSRRLFGEHDRLLRWSPIEVEFLSPRRADAASAEAVDRLCAEVRRSIMAHCAEPGRA